MGADRTDAAKQRRTFSTAYILRNILAKFAQHGDIGYARVSTLDQDFSRLVEHRLRVIGGTERENAIGDKREAGDQCQTINEVSA